MPDSYISFSLQYRLFSRNIKKERCFMDNDAYLQRYDSEKFIQEFLALFAGLCTAENSSLRHGNLSQSYRKCIQECF